MRLLDGLFLEHADLVEVSLDETFLRQRVERFPDGRIVVGRLQQDVQVYAFGVFCLIGLADDDEHHGPFEIVVVVGGGHHSELHWYLSGLQLSPAVG